MAAQIYRVAYDFSHAEAAIDIVAQNGADIIPLRQLPIIEGIEEINYSTTVEREKMYGSSRIPLARTEGSAEFEASITMQAYWWRYIIDTMNELGLGLAKAELNITYSLFQGGSVPVHTDFLYRCAIKSPESAFKRGNENLMIPVSLDPMNIFYDGFDVFGNPLT